MTLLNVISLDDFRQSWRPQDLDGALDEADARIRAGLAELHVSIVKLSDEVAELRAGIDELAKNIEAARGDEPEGDTPPVLSACAGPDGQGCQVGPGCRCDCGCWDGICDDPLTPEELAKWGCWCFGLAERKCSPSCGEL